MNFETFMIFLNYPLSSDRTDNLPAPANKFSLSVVTLDILIMSILLLLLLYYYYLLLEIREQNFYQLECLLW